MKRKNTVVVKQRDEWSGLAEFLGNMIAKYAEAIDFDSLPEPDEYLARCCMKRMYRAYRREQQKLQKRKMMLKWNIIYDKIQLSEKKNSAK